MEQNRFENIDICKGILMLIVILNHGLSMTSWNENFLHCWNSAIAMPAFFVLSGLLYHHEKWSRLGFRAFFLHRFQTLIVPYLFFDLTGGALVQILLGHWSGLNGHGLVWECLRLLRNTLCLTCNLSPNWFLPTLFFAELLLFAARSAAKHKRILLLLALIAFACSALYVHIPIPAARLAALGKRFSRVLLAFVFLVIGSAGKRYFLRKQYKLWQVLAAFCIVCLEYFVNGRPLMASMNISYVTVFVLCGCAGAFFVLAVSSMIRSHALVLVGRNSLILVGTHYMIRNLIVMLPGYSAPISWSMFFVYLLGVAMLSAFCIPIYPILFPHLIGKKLLYDPRKHDCS